jgi:hypothetical protein
MLVHKGMRNTKKSHASVFTMKAWAEISGFIKKSEPEITIAKDSAKVFM